MTCLTDLLRTAISHRSTVASVQRSSHARRQRIGDCFTAEILETRTLLSSTFVVDTTSDFSGPDDGVTSLREAVEAANANPGHDTIIFDPSLAGKTITVAQSSEIRPLDELTITGLGADLLTISRGGPGGNILRASAALHLSGVTLSNAGPPIGGGFQGFALYLEGDATVVDVTFRDNGNGAIVHTTGHLHVENSRFIDNFANLGGAIRISGPISPTATIVNSLFQNNSSGGDGGAIWNTAGNLTVSGSLFEGNVAPGSGGAIWSSSHFSSGGGDLNVINSTFTGNSADAYGGAIQVSNGGADLVVTNSTIVLNRADADGDGFGIGGGASVRQNSTGTLYNTIVAGNMIGAPSFETPNDLTNTTIFGEKGVEPASSHNLIGDAASSGGLLDGTNGNIVGVDVNDVIEPLANNGGPAQTHAINSGSLAHDAGDNSLIPADALDLDGDNDTAEPIPFDQRGSSFDRIAGSAVDIGAFEINNQPPILQPDLSNQFRLDVTYTGGGIVSGPLFGGLSALPDQVVASFVIDTSGGGTTFGLSDVVSALATFGDAVWDESLLDSFSLQIDPVAGNVSDLTYQFRTIDLAPADGIAIGNFPLTISGTDTATGQPFEYRYTDSSQLLSPAIDVAENQTLVFDFDSTDPDGETEAGGGLTYSLTGGADQGLFAIDADTGVLSFVAAPDFENPGDADGDNTYHVQVSVTDSGGLSAAQDIAVDVTNVNEPPTVSGPIVVTASEDAFAFSLNLLAGAADVDAGDTLSVANLVLTGGDDTGVSVNGNSLDVAPSAYNHLAVGEPVVISYTYDIVDGNGGTIQQSATITIEGANDAPTVGGPVVATVSADDAAFSVDLLAGASDVDASDTLNVADLALTGGDAAGVSVNGNSLDVDPSAYGHLAAGESEVITYTYDIIDGNGGTVTQTVSITIEGGSNAPPVAADFSRAGTEDSPVQLAAADFIANFSDADGDPLVEIRIDALPASGILELNGVGVTAGQIIAAGDLDNFVFVPDVNFNGQTSFAYSAGDGIAFSLSPATVTLDILSTAEQVDLLNDKIDELLAAGIINEGQANALMLMLKENNGDVGKVGAFLNEVQGFVNGGILTADQAQDLIVCGELLLQSLLTG